MMFPLLGTIFYVGLLIVNAMAVLSEERFLAPIGWASSKPQNTGFNQYDQNGFGGQQGDVGIKAKLIDLISAVRTLMRIPLIALNILVIGYELVLGG